AAATPGPSKHSANVTNPDMQTDASSKKNQKQFLDYIDLDSQ
ncbi:12388_t:CDS:1, partial [Cetraspora pellucida]